MSRSGAATEVSPAGSAAAPGHHALMGVMTLPSKEADPGDPSPMSSRLGRAALQSSTRQEDARPARAQKETTGEGPVRCPRDTGGKSVPG